MDKSQTTERKMFWRDKDVETLTREELIEALRGCYSMYRSLADSHASTLNMWQLCNEARHARI